MLGLFKSASKLVDPVIELCRVLISDRGDVMGPRLATETLAAYQALPESALPAFWDLIVSEFSSDPNDVSVAIDGYRAQPSEQTLSALRKAVEPPRQELFRRLNVAHSGTAALVDLRARVLPLLPNHPEWAPIDTDLTHLFRSWFNKGFLTLHRIDWHSSAVLLEKLIQYEAVHQIRDWHDLRRRLQADRRCYAFLHAALPDEPLIFIEVALTRGIPATVRPLLSITTPVDDPDRADTAVFYSITNCQLGLRGISFGNVLIKQVAEDLHREFRRIRTFASISPLSGFAHWLGGDQANYLSPTLSAALKKPDREALSQLPQEVKEDIVSLGAQYLLHAKDGDVPVDPVARFHLANGARAERINWMGDDSPDGIRRSLGLMVNYVYSLSHVEANHQAYVKNHEVVASRSLRRLAREYSSARRALIA
jgi:malonyl-CoA decarboxylase